MDPISDSASVDLGDHVLVICHFQEDEHGVLIAIANLSCEAHSGKSVDELFKPLLCLCLVCYTRLAFTLLEQYSVQSTLWIKTKHCNVVHP